MNCTALIVTYNRLTKLKNCLKATLLLPFNHIIIVNNASTDNTAEWLLTQQDPRLHILTTQINIGGAGGFKHGAHFIANYLDTEWIFFFDDDAYPAVNLLDQFNRLNKQDYQIFSSKVLLPSGKICKMNVPYKKVPYTACETVLYGIKPHKFLPNLLEQEEVQTFSFVGAVLHQNILRQYTHLIDEQLFLYFDDVLFSYHLSQSGYKILFSPNLIFIHDTTINTNIYQNKKIYYMVRNLVYLKENQYSPFSKCSISLRIIRILILCIYRGKNIHSILYILKGIKDGFLHKKPK
ncbi:GT2 family (WcaE) (PDB:2Z86) [Commensalibacter communis]|uniref:glycosyltransferase n=1 Tax=Commensalibacter communis TaxID=2972786 RepID=UPI0022FFA178|nr:glycosyltransferase [Commensalibacter communis]CAI3957962.1 GT2 family (WcaE) (PDB:2Z86) [Commensalibacter communis]CAI3958304.1 GT2 family (WcaE) (PDB:2Z86) [Commensalibacter communis]